MLVRFYEMLINLKQISFIHLQGSEITFYKNRKTKWSIVLRNYELASKAIEAIQNNAKHDARIIDLREINKDG